MKFTDQQFLSAIRDTHPQRGQMEQITQIVGCSHTTVLKRIYKLAEEGKVQVHKRRAYDPQPHRDGWGHSLFGGAGVCIRRYLVAEIVEDDPTPWCHVCGAAEQKNCDCGPIAANH